MSLLADISMLAPSREARLVLMHFLPFREVAAAVERAEILRSQMLTWPPVNGAGKKHRTLDQVMSDEMGFLD